MIVKLSLLKKGKTSISEICIIVKMRWEQGTVKKCKVTMKAFLFFVLVLPSTKCIKQVNLLLEQTVLYSMLFYVLVDIKIYMSIIMLNFNPPPLSTPSSLNFKNISLCSANSLKYILEK